MREILTIIKGNFRKNKSAYISIAVLIMVVSMAFMAVFSILLNNRNHDKESIESTGFGHIIAGIRYDETLENYKEFANNLADDIEACEGVERVDRIPSHFIEIADLNGKDSGNSNFLLDYQSEYVHYRIFDEKDNEIRNPVINQGEICVPVCFKSLYDCQVGDVITLTFGEFEGKYKIVSFFEDPYMGSSMMGIKTLLVCDTDFEKIARSSEKHGDGMILSIFKDENNTMNDAEFDAYLNRETSYAGFSWITLSRSQALDYMMMLIDIFAGILIVFILMLVIATLIVLSHNISNSIEQDFTNIGILKAVGMTNRKIKCSIMLGYVMAGFIGTLIGIPLTIPAIAEVNELIRPTTGLYAKDTPAFLISGLVILGVFVLMVLFIQIKLMKLSKVTPVSAINGGREDVHFSSIFKLPISKKLFSPSIAYRQLTSAKKQYAGSIMITAILVMFMIMISGMYLWFSDGGKKLDEFFSPVSYDMTIRYMSEDALNKYEEEVDSLVDSYGKADKYQYYHVYLLFNDSQFQCGINSNPNQFQTVYKGRTCLYENEILITEYVSRNYGVDIGDAVELSYEDKTQEYIVSGFYQSSNDAGKNIAMSLEGYKRLTGEDGRGGSYVYKFENEENAEKMADEIVAALQEKYTENEIVVSKVEIFDGINMIIAGVQGIAVIIYLLAGVFIVVTILMVCGKLFAKEKKDYGIYKAMGITSKRLRRMFALRFVITSLIGSLLGVLLACMFSDAIIGAIFASFGVINFEAETSAPAIIVPIAFMAIVYYIFSYLVSRRMKKVTPRVLITE